MFVAVGHWSLECLLFSIIEAKKLTNTTSIYFPKSPCVVLVGEQAQVPSAYFLSRVEPYSTSPVPSIGLFRGEGDYLWLEQSVVLFWD